MVPVRATYRVQLHAGFTFDDAAAIVPYLAELGITHLYCSPYLQAVRGSTHGYDVVDHGRLNEELGGEAAHTRMCDALSAAGMGHILDIVPNHMAIARENAWWWDVLENGPSSQYAAYFDIDWDPPERRLTTKVLVPVLGDHYGRVLESGELQVVRAGGAFTVRYHEHEAPVSPRTLDDLLAAAANRTNDDALASLADAFGRLPHALATDRDSVRERHRDKEVLRGRLEELLASNDELAIAVDDELSALNDDPDALDVLLSRQNYRLAFWRTAGRELDYRRFFDITTLVALRIEDPQAFQDTHALVLDLVRQRRVCGLRVDHVDGLRDPFGYLERLREQAGSDTFIVVEKILEGSEALPASWPVQGTSGYDFLVQANNVLVDPAGEERLTAVYQQFTGESSGFEDIAHAAKHEIMRSVLAADVERLTELFVLVAEDNRRHRDYTRSQLRDALRETMAAFDVYRTYVRRGDEPTEVDVARIDRATTEALRRRPDLEPELFGFLRDVLLLRVATVGGVRSDLAMELAERVQQVTSPVMAKSVEDTSFYRYHRLISLNEVGGDPSEFGASVAEFHDRIAANVATQSLLGSSTHDTKRSEDVRARLACLSEIPDAWGEAAWRWAHRNDGHRTAGFPDRNAEYLLYQTIVGTWPLTPERAVAYMGKAVKEAKSHTSWIDPVPEYDAALIRFTDAVLRDPDFNAEVETFLAAERLVAAGRANSLVQTALKLTCPGVPDVYQGAELWDLSLVDPDNRRPVDYDARRRLLSDARSLSVEELAARIDDPDDPGVPKLWLIDLLLGLRASRPELFDHEAGYEPLRVDGPDAERVIAFSRRRGALVTVVARFPMRGAIDAATTVEFPDGTVTAVAELLGPLPVAIVTP